jgi:hypothetical protein
MIKNTFTGFEKITDIYKMIIPSNEERVQEITLAQRPSADGM